MAIVKPGVKKKKDEYEIKAYTDAHTGGAAAGATTKAGTSPLTPDNSALGRLNARTYGDYKSGSGQKNEQSGNATMYPVAPDNSVLGRLDRYTNGDYKSGSEQQNEQSENAVNSLPPEIAPYAGLPGSSASPSVAENENNTQNAQDAVTHYTRDNYPGVMRDHEDMIGPTGINEYYFDVLQSKLRSRQAPSAADYLNAFTLMSVEDAEMMAERAAAYFTENEKPSRTDWNGNASAPGTVKNAPSRENTARMLDEIYNEYLEGAYYKNAVEEGRRLAEDVLGKYASMTGGMPSTAATYAATSAGNDVMSDAQKYLWSLAQQQFESERRDARADAETEKDKYTSMIDAYLKMGYGISDVPDEWWSRSGYDRDYAAAQADYFSDTDDDSTSFYSDLLNRYLSSGMDVPDGLYERAGYTPEEEAAQRAYLDAFAEMQRANAAPAETKSRDEWTTDDYDNAADVISKVMEMYTSGYDYAGYLAALGDDALAEYAYDYLSVHTPLSARSWQKNGNQYVDEFGNEMSKSELKTELESEGMTSAEANSFIGKIK